MQETEAALKEAQRQQEAAQRDIADARARLEQAAEGLTEMADDAAKACLHRNLTTALAASWNTYWWCRTWCCQPLPEHKLVKGRGKTGRWGYPAVQICAEEESLEAAEALRAIWLETGRAKDADDTERMLRRDALEKRCALALASLQCGTLAVQGMITSIIGACRAHGIAYLLFVSVESTVTPCMPTVPQAPCACCPCLLTALLQCARRAAKLRRDIQKREMDMAVTLDELRVGASSRAYCLHRAWGSVVTLCSFAGAGERLGP